MEKFYNAYTNILREELIEALGCTEPITIAYASALGRKYFQGKTEKIVIYASPSMIKNAKSVVIPNTNGMKGMKVGAIIGFLGGDSDKVMTVLDSVEQSHIDKMNTLLHTDFCEIKKIDNAITLQIIIELIGDNENVQVEISEMHTNVVRLERNGDNLLKGKVKDSLSQTETDRSILNIKDIYDYCTNADIKLFEEIINIQIENNKVVAEEGLKNDYGVCLGKTLMSRAVTLQDEVKAYACAGSDARMGGCTSAVTIVSGSGNQGLTVSNPLQYYADKKEIDRETLIRGVAMANLIGLEIKRELSRLSAYCGVVCASTGVASALTYFEKGNIDQIEMTIKNMLSNLSGMICDGAKESCALKIASAIDAGFMSHYLAIDKKAVEHGCGIIHRDVEKTIKNIGVLGRIGMKETNDVILDIMLSID